MNRLIDEVHRALAAGLSLEEVLARVTLEELRSLLVGRDPARAEGYRAMVEQAVDRAYREGVGELP